MAGLVLHLYVAGGTASARAAVAALERLRRDLDEPCEVRIVDVLAEPDVAARDRVVVTPTLVRLSPLPRRRVVGDLENPEEVLRGLDLHEGPHREGAA